MATTTEKEPSQAERLAAEAEAGMGANAQAVDQTDRAVNTEDEKTLNEQGPSPSPSLDAVAVLEKAGPPAPEEKQRSKGKIVLLMLALGVFPSC